MYVTPQLKNTIKKEFDKAIEITEHSQIPSGIIKKNVIYNSYNYWKAKSDNHLFALMMVYNLGKAEGMKENEACLNFNKMAMFHNVKTFLSLFEIDNPSYKDFKKWQNELMEELEELKKND